MQTCLLMERTSYILFKKHLWVNDPWVLPVSSILLLPVKLLPWVLPQEIKTQRDLITRRGTGRPRLSSAALWMLSKPILPKHRVSLQGADACSFFSSRGGWGFLCSHNLSRCSWVRSEATVQSSDGARGGLPMQTHASSGSILATPRWCSISGLISSHELWLPLQQGTRNADMKPVHLLGAQATLTLPCVSAFSNQRKTLSPMCWVEQKLITACLSVLRLAHSRKDWSSERNTCGKENTRGMCFSSQAGRETDASFAVHSLLSWHQWTNFSPRWSGCKASC